MSPRPRTSLSSRATLPRPPSFPGLHSPFSWARYPPASDLLEGGVRQLNAQWQQRGPHSQPQRGPQPAPPEVHPHPPSALAFLAGHKHSVTGLRHLWENRGTVWAKSGRRVWTREDSSDSMPKKWASVFTVMHVLRLRRFRHESSIHSPWRSQPIQVYLGLSGGNWLFAYNRTFLLTEEGLNPQICLFISVDL